ncbi:MAG: YbjQ family protein [Acidobacteriota bacterium]
MIVITADAAPPRRIERTLGLVRGNAIRARHIGTDIMAVLRGLVGGEVSEYTKLFAETREQALDRMVAEALTLGANGIVCVRFSTSMVMSGAAELLCCGTAVVLSELEPAG